MTKKQNLNSLNKKARELKNTLQELQSAIENESLPLKDFQSRSFSYSFDQGEKVLIYVGWKELFYKRNLVGKDFLKDHFYIPDAVNILDDVILTADRKKTIRVMSDIPEISTKFRKSFDVTILKKGYKGKISTSKRSGKDVNKLIDIFELITKHLAKEVKSLDLNQENLRNILSDIEGDLYELRNSTSKLLEYEIKRSKEIGILVLIAIACIVGVIIIDSIV